MAYDGPEIFLAPYGNEAALSNFERTVETGVPIEEVERHTRNRFEGEVVRLWGTKETVSGTWKNVDPGDFLLFYRDGQYRYAAEVVETERNEPLGRAIWPNFEDGNPWSCIIYLDEPVELGVDSSDVHHLASYGRDFPLGFSPLNEMGIGGIRGRYGSVAEFVYRERSDGEPSKPDVRNPIDVQIPTEVFSHLHFPGGIEGVVDQINSALNAGKHVMFTGPPGTGKTAVAKEVCRHLVEENPEVYTGYRMTTATADWSTFETVGGYMPEESDGGTLSFEPGQVLRRFKHRGEQRNDLLVIDEINRADIDKSFGQLFTLLSGQGVQLPYKRNGEEISIYPAAEFEDELTESVYLMPTSWRILATMNSYDKTSLYELSYAFMRRFAFIHIDAPDVPDDEAGQIDLVRSYAEVWGLEVEEELLAAIGDVWHVTNSTVEERKIGPAIVRDMLAHTTRADADRRTALTRAIANYVFPQLEGLPRRERIVKELAKSPHVDGREFDSLARSVLGVSADG